MPDQSRTSQSPATSPLLRRTCLLACIVVWTTEAVLTHIPLPKLPEAVPGDKTLHVIAYTAIASTLLLALWAYGRPLGRRLLVALLVLAVYGAVDELTQPWGNRHASWLDWLADMGGVGIACGLHVAAEAMVARVRRHRGDASTAS